MGNNKKKIYVYDKLTGGIKEYNTHKEASIITNITEKTITSNCNLAKLVKRRFLFADSHLKILKNLVQLKLVEVS